MISPEEALAVPLLAVLPEGLRERIIRRAADVTVAEGEWFVFEGDPASFWIVISGEIEVMRTVAGRLERATTFDPGEFFGEVPLMLGSGSPRGCRALRTSRLMRIDPTEFHAMVVNCPEAGAMLAQTLVRRVNVIREGFAAMTQTRATIVGGHYDFRCHDIRDFLSRNQVPFEWLDPSDPGDRQAIAPDLLEVEQHPIVVVDSKIRLVQPSLREVANALELQTQPNAGTYDVAIVGGGPAGLAAAVYGGSEGLRSIMIEREAPGGQAGTSSRIENYLGFPGGISGSDLANRGLNQAKRFKSEILVTRSVSEIRPSGALFEIALDGDQQITTRAIVIATGVAWRMLHAEGAERLLGRGIYYGAARTEALETRGRDIFLIGGGNSAGQAAMFFANYARSVTLLVRGSSLEKSMSHYLIAQLHSKENIAVETGVSLERAIGDEHLEAIVTRDEHGVEKTRPADDLFAFIGADAETAWLPSGIERDTHGYIRTGGCLETWTLERAPYALETSIPGIFAAGDVRSESVKRVASGVGEGSMVIAYVHQYFDTLARLEAAPAR
jgi:thioredoxin reductase (NADPH)